MRTLAGPIHKTRVRERREGTREEREVQLCWKVQSGFEMLKATLQPFHMRVYLRNSSARVVRSNQLHGTRRMRENLQAPDENQRPVVEAAGRDFPLYL